MAGFGKSNSVIHRLAFANFADHDHVRRLAQCVFERHGPALSVAANFALRDNAVAMLVHELDGVLNGDDVAARVAITMITIAAIDVVLPLPVAPTKITKPRLAMMMSRRIGGSINSSKRGMVTLIVRITMPTWFCCMNALHRKRPVPGGLIAKLHSLVRSNSAACLSFMIERASVSVCNARIEVDCRSHL